jgi:hypothetical protein
MNRIKYQNKKKDVSEVVYIHTRDFIVRPERSIKSKNISTKKQAKVLY